MRKFVLAGTALVALLGLAILLWFMYDPAPPAPPEVAGILHDDPQVEPEETPLNSEPSKPLSKPEPEPEAPPDPEPEVKKTEPEAEVEPPEDEPPKGRFVSGNEKPGAVVIVRFEDSSCLPDTAWLIWENEEDGRQEGADFDPKTREARIAIHAYLNEDRKAEGTARAYCKWFGRLLETEAFEVKRDETQTVILTPPDGAELLARVLGPSGHPLPGVLLRMTIADERMQATTDAAGEARFTGIPAPTTPEVEIGEINGGLCCKPAESLSFSTPGDRQEVLFDLTGTGIVECNLTSGDKSLISLDITSLSDSGHWPDVYLWYKTKLRTRIYGLKPGQYKVTASTWDGLKFTGEFEVLNPPQISKWERDFQTRTLTVRVYGAPSTQDMRLYRWAGWRSPSDGLKPQVSGEFVVEGLSGELWLHVRGGGWSSRVYKVNPEETSELDVEVVRAGTLKLVPRKKPANNIEVKFADGGVLRIGGSYRRTEDVVELPPGNYTVESWDFRPGDTSFDITIKVGEITERVYGPEYVSTLELRSRDRRSLWDFDVTIKRDGEVVEVTKYQVWTGGDEYFRLEFQAEGKLVLRIKGEGIEEFVREFEIERDKTLNLEIDIKDKQ